MERKYNPIGGLTLLSILWLACSVLATAQTVAVDSAAASARIRTAYGFQPQWKVNSAISTIDGDNLSNVFHLNTGLRLAGKLPGLTVMPGSHEPGLDNPSFYIRGLNTFGSGRGILVLVDGIESFYENLVPEEIASISVLKDASALALYGSRGANGALLVTTKRGVEGPLKVSLGIQYGVSQPIRLPEFLDAHGYATLYNEALANDGLPPQYSAEDLDSYRVGSDKFFHPNVNWYDEILRKAAPVTNYDLNFRGGNSTIKYFVLLNLASDDGLYKRTADQSIHTVDQDYSRFNFRSNLDINVTKNFNFELLFGVQNQRKTNPKDNNTESMFTLLSRIPPNAFPVRNPDGTYGASSIFSNPLGDALMTGMYTSNTRTFLMRSTATQKLDMVTEGLSASLTAAFNNYFSSLSNKTRDYARYSISGDLNNVIYNQIGQDESLSASENAENHANNTEWQFALNYERNLGASDLDVMLMYSEFTATVPAVAIPYRNNALRGRLGYAYRGKYIMELAAAYNGTENFPKESRWGLFPAVSLGWIVSNETFLSNNSVVNHLKVRGSYGLVGNDDIGGTRFMFNPQPYVEVGSYYYGRTNSFQSTIAEGQIRNGNVTWEKEKKLNIGFDATILRQVDVRFDIFDNDRYDILAQPVRTVPAFMGFGVLPDYNIGKTNNKGFEAALTYRKSRDVFGYYVSASMWYARNKIVYSAEEIRAYDYLNRTGHRIDQPFRFVSRGFFSDVNDIENNPRQIFDEVRPGDIKYADQNGDGIIDQNDVFPVGYTNVPEISGGFEIGVNYKSFDINIFLQGVTNRTVYRSGYYYEAFQNDGKVTTVALGRWTPETQGTATYPRLSASNNLNNFQSSTFWMSDGSFLKVRNVEVGYNFPQALTNKLKLEGARVFVNGTNLLSFDELEMSDPENLTGYPIRRTFSIGAKFQF